MKSVKFELRELLMGSSFDLEEEEKIILIDEDFSFRSGRIINLGNF